MNAILPNNMCTMCGKGTYAVGQCPACNQASKASARANRARIARQARKEAMDSIGMKRVRGAMGGTYYE